MKNLLLCLLLVVGSLTGARATNYYVSSGVGTPVVGVNATGGGRGLSAALPFATIQYAADRTNPGDTVFVRSGTYSNTSASGNVVTISRPGTANAWIVYRNYPGDTQRPLLQFNGWQGFLLTTGSAYVEVSGFRIQGNNRNVLLADATNQPGGCAQNGIGSPSPLYNGNGISIDGRASGAGVHPHHLRVVGNEVFECGGGGINAIQADYVTIENNLVYNNSWYTFYGTSGISVLSAWNLDQTPNYRTIVQNNRCFGNRLLVPWWRGGTFGCAGFTDGNGIIIDSNTDLMYSGRTLVANNLCVNNGGSGMHALKCRYVDFINNTAFSNSQTAQINDGEIYTNRGTDCLIQNNILYAAPNKVLNTNYNNVRVTITNNLYFGGTGAANSVAVPGSSPVRANPLFLNPTTDWTTADFRLATGSPAIDVGLAFSNLPPTDLAGNPRVVGPAPDLGAYEFNAVLTNISSALLSPAVLECYPNPVGHRATLRYVTSRPGPVQLQVLDGLGHRVALLVDETEAAGPHEVQLERLSLSAGLYHVLLITPEGRMTRTLMQK